MVFSFRQLEVVRAVSRHGSVTMAALALGISQPAVSMMLRECTAQAGFPLFRRQQGRMQPTAETGALLTDLERVFEGVERINRLVEEMRDISVGSVHVAVTPALTESLLPQAVARLQRSRPGIQIAIDSVDILGVTEMVTQERVDFGLVLAPLGHADARLVPLYGGALVAVVAPDHPLAGQPHVTPADLAAHPLISFSRIHPLGELIEGCFQAAGVKRRIAVEVNQSSVACAMVRAGAGVTVIDPFLLSEARDHGVVCLPLRPSVPVNALALVPRQRRLSRPAQLLLATLRRLAAGQQREGRATAPPVEG